MAEVLDFGLFGGPDSEGVYGMAILPATNGKPSSQNCLELIAGAIAHPLAKSFGGTMLGERGVDDRRGM